MCVKTKGEGKEESCVSEAVVQMTNHPVCQRVPWDMAFPVLNRECLRKTGRGGSS